MPRDGFLERSVARRAEVAVFQPGLGVCRYKRFVFIPVSCGRKLSITVITIRALWAMLQDGRTGCNNRAVVHGRPAFLYATYT